MSKITDHANTPHWLYDKMTRDYWDPCPNIPDFNGLEVPWRKKTFCNPPYSTKIPWILKAIQESKLGNKIIMLLPVDTSAKWFHELIFPNFDIFFMQSRLHLDNGHHPKFPSMLIRIPKLTV